MGVSASEALPAGAKRSDPEPVPNSREVLSQCDDDVSR